MRRIVTNRENFILKVVQVLVDVIKIHNIGNFWIIGVNLKVVVFVFRNLDIRLSFINIDRRNIVIENIIVRHQVSDVGQGSLIEKNYEIGFYLKTLLQGDWYKETFVD